MGSACDVLVIGGGPAGLAAAIACAREGLVSTLVDPAHPPIDKACGEGILPGGLHALRELGIDIPTSARLAGIHFLSDNADVRAEFPNGDGAGIRRTVLHEAMRRRTEELGAEIRWGSRVEELAKGIAVVDGEELAFRFAVIADGQHSIWRERCGFADINLRRQRFGFRRHYRIAPWSEFVEVHWIDGAQIYVTPVGPEEVGIALLTSDQHADFDKELAKFERVAEKVRGRGENSKLRGGVCATRTITHITRGNLALIGDASGSVDAITGDGISIALHASVALARAIRYDRLYDYEAAHREIMRRPRQMGELLLAMDRHPRFRRKALTAMTRHPEMFRKFLGLHTGAMRLKDFGVRDAVVLLREMGS